jgi:hypothetical protein
MGLIDWAADKVQSFTGEKERRALVQKIKNLAQKFRDDVGKIIAKLNESIKSYNEKLRVLNAERQGVVKSNVYSLFNFLSKFGSVKEPGQYCSESERKLQIIPERQFEKIDNYIKDIDWSKGDIELNTFFLTPFGMKSKTRRQNLSMIEHINELQLYAEEVLNELNQKIFAAGLDRQVCVLYTEIVRSISNFITEKIVPELRIVEAFFETLSISDAIIAGQTPADAKFYCNIAVLDNSSYEKHYLFVKNAFAFYVFSCKVYNTPILTRLLKHDVYDSDKGTLELYKTELLSLSKSVESQTILYDQKKVA